MQSHEHHARVNAWWPGRALAVCPITELGFLRVACALGSTMEDARTVLAEFLRDEAPAFIVSDRPSASSGGCHRCQSIGAYDIDACESRDIETGRPWAGVGVPAGGAAG